MCHCADSYVPSAAFWMDDDNGWRRLICFLFPFSGDRDTPTKISPQPATHTRGQGDYLLLNWCICFELTFDDLWPLFRRQNSPFPVCSPKTFDSNATSLLTMIFQVLRDPTSLSAFLWMLSMTRRQLRDLGSFPFCWTLVSFILIPSPFLTKSSSPGSPLVDFFGDTQIQIDWSTRAIQIEPAVLPLLYSRVSSFLSQATFFLFRDSTHKRASKDISAVQIHFATVRWSRRIP